MRWQGEDWQTAEINPTFQPCNSQSSFPHSTISRVPTKFVPFNFSRPNSRKARTPGRRARDTRSGRPVMRIQLPPRTVPFSKTKRRPSKHARSVPLPVPDLRWRRRRSGQWEEKTLECHRTWHRAAPVAAVEKECAGFFPCEIAPLSAPNAAPVERLTMGSLAVNSDS